MNPNNQENRWPCVLTRLSIIALILGAVFSVVPLAYVFAPFVGLLVVIDPCFRHSISRFRVAMPAIAFVFVNVACFAILALAHFAPVKTTDDYLTRKLSLPKTRITLAEMAKLDAPPHRPLHLLGVSISVPQDEADVVIEFPATELTMRQFVDAVEQQSTLRHRFAHCGNGSTILWGGDCSFGLHLRHPRTY